MTQSERVMAHVAAVQDRAMQACGCKGCMAALKARDDARMAREWKAMRNAEALK